jgi:predicted transcriptional regulator
MALSKLFDIKASVIPTEQVTVKLDVDLVAYADELAAELELTRSDVIREAFRDGMRRTWADWQEALEQGKRETAERSERTGGKPGKGQK